MSKSLKRKDVSNNKPAVKKQKLQKTAHARPIVRGDALKWKEVTLPDRMDDAEGFYGLEEIDDVEILKDENGVISFRPMQVENVIVGEGEVAGEEWDGFDDVNDKASNDPPEANGTTQPAASKGKDMKSKPKPQSSKKTPKDDPKSKAKVEKIATPKPASTTSQASDLEDEVDFGALDDLDEEVQEQAQEQADITAWKELNLSQDLLSAISVLGYSDPTPIQKAAIPPIRKGCDVVGKAVTGSGKTLAFGVPIVESWLESRSERASGPTIPTAFILAPTRELAHQLTKHLTALSKGLEQSPRIATVTGGLALVKQQRQLEYADIIIGTPGRLWEVINSSHGLIDRLKQIRFLVIDEADRLLSEGHFKEVEEILDVLDRKVIDETGDENTEESVQPRQRQTLVFSATFHKGLQQKLASKQKKWSGQADLLSNTQSLDYLIQKLRFQKGVKPTFIDANPTSSMAEKLSESILECGAMQKDLYLYSLLLLHQHQHTKALRSLQSSSSQDSSITRTLVFTNSISTVKRLVPLLTTLAIPHTTVLPLHSSMPQKSRLRSLERFTSPPNPSDTTAILVATDVAARGLDIQGVHTVIHYHVPRAADTYVHRSGRTARASHAGRSILICSPDEVGGVTRLVAKIHADQTNPRSKARGRGAITPFYLPADLHGQLSPRVSLAQRITGTSIDTGKSKSEGQWLRAAAEELGVDYESDDFETDSKRMKRGRGGGRDKKRKEAVEISGQGQVGAWRAELKQELATRRVDFGDGQGVGKSKGKYLAGGAVDMERLLREGV